MVYPKRPLQTKTDARGFPRKREGFTPLMHAMWEMQRQDPSYNGTPTGLARRCRSVFPGSIVKLLRGQTPPWKVATHISRELLRVLGPYGLREEHFRHPDTF